MIVCKRCGACCYHFIDGKIKKCKFLMRLSSNRTLCRIYDNRLGKVLYNDKKGFIIVCKNRLDVKKHFPNCPYNEKIFI